MFDIKELVANINTTLTNNQNGKNVVVFAEDFYNDSLEDEAIRVDGIFTMGYEIILEIQRRLLKWNNITFIIAFDVSAYKLILSTVVESNRNSNKPTSYYCNNMLYDPLNGRLCNELNSGFMFTDTEESIVDSIRKFNDTDNQVKIFACVY